MSKIHKVVQCIGTCLYSLYERDIPGKFGVSTQALLYKVSPNAYRKLCVRIVCVCRTI